jgi:PHP family Zn ribbon phosphoesterase
MTLPEIGRWAACKGIDLVGTGDFTHPLWFREIGAELEEAGEGLYKLKSRKSKVKATTQNSKLNNPLLITLIHITNRDFFYLLTKWCW